MVFSLFKRKEQPTGAGVSESLEKTRGGLFGAVRNLFQARRELD